MAKPVRVKGLRETQRAISDLVRRLDAAATKGVEDVALDLLGRAVADAPVDTGDLRRSGSVVFNGREIAKGIGDGTIQVLGQATPTKKPMAVVGFGVPYAYVQDQDRTFRHPRGGKAGYLSDNFRSREKRYLDHIMVTARKGLTGR